MGFENLSDILLRFRNGKGQLSRCMAEADAMALWNQAVGPLIAKHTRPLRVKDGSLWVEVDHPIWRTELHHRKSQILDQLNSKQAPSEKGRLIEDIFFVDIRTEPRRPQFRKD